MDAHSMNPQPPSSGDARIDPRTLAVLRESMMNRLAEIDAALAGGIGATSPPGDLHRERRRLEAALARVEEGRYGLCCVCETALSLEQLRVDPAVPFCMDCEADVRTSSRARV